MIGNYIDIFLRSIENSNKRKNLLNYLQKLVNQKEHFPVRLKKVLERLVKNFIQTEDISPNLFFNLFRILMEIHPNFNIETIKTFATKLKIILSKIDDILNFYSSFDFVSIFISFTRNNITVSKYFSEILKALELKICQDLKIKRKLNSYSLKHVAELFYCISKFNLYHEETMFSFINLFENNLNLLNLDSLAIILEILISYEVKDIQLITEIIKKINMMLLSKNKSIIHFYQLINNLHFILIQIQLFYPEYNFEVKFIKDFVEKNKNYKMSIESNSRFQQTVFNYIKENFKGEFYQEHRIECFSIDFYFPKNKICLETHGTSHFIGKNLNHKSLKKMKILEKMGYVNIIISCHDWMKLNDIPELEKKYVVNILNQNV